MLTALATIHPIGRFDFKNFNEGAVRFVYFQVAQSGAVRLLKGAQNRGQWLQKLENEFLWTNLQTRFSLFLSLVLYLKMIQVTDVWWINRYLKVAAIPQKCMGPLKGWRANKSNFPEIASLSKDAPFIHATSVYREPHFSDAENKITSSRNRISYDIIQACMLNKVWMKYLSTVEGFDRGRSGIRLFHRQTSGWTWLVMAREVYMVRLRFPFPGRGSAAQNSFSERSNFFFCLLPM